MVTYLCWHHDDSFTNSSTRRNDGNLSRIADIWTADNSRLSQTLSAPVSGYKFHILKPSKETDNVKQVAYQQSAVIGNWILLTYQACSSTHFSFTLKTQTTLYARLRSTILLYKRIHLTSTTPNSFQFKTQIFSNIKGRTFAGTL